MKLIRSIGLVTFLFSFGLFLATFFLGEYQLTEEIFSSNVEAPHQELLRPKLQAVLGQQFSQPGTLASAISDV